MTLWLLEINSKLSSIEKILRKIGIKSMTTCELVTVEAETQQDAIKKSGRNPKKWKITGQEIKRIDSNPVGTRYYTNTSS